MKGPTLRIISPIIVTIAGFDSTDDVYEELFEPRKF